MTTHFGHDPYDCACDNEHDYDPTPWKTAHQRAAGIERLEQRLSAAAMRENRAAGRHELFPVRVFLLPDEVHCICGATIAGVVPAADRFLTAECTVHIQGPDLAHLHCPHDIATVPA